MSNAPSVRSDSCVQVLSILYVAASTSTADEYALSFILAIRLSDFVRDSVSSSALSIPDAPLQISSAVEFPLTSYIVIDTKVSNVKLSCLYGCFALHPAVKAAHSTVSGRTAVICDFLIFSPIVLYYYIPKERKFQPILLNLYYVDAPITKKLHFFCVCVILL